jgi:hypothetical protein
MRTFLLILVLSPLFGLAQIVSSVNLQSSSLVPLLTFDKPFDIEQLMLEDDTKRWKLLQICQNGLLRFIAKK